MQVKKKTMKREEWDYIEEKRYISKEYEDKVVGLIIIDKVNKPLIIKHNNKLLKIIDKNYKWLEFAPKNENYFMTAMFDDNDELIEIYFDINSGNNFEDITNPYFYDMFVDLCITKQNSVDSMDEEELEKAYQENLLTEKEYNFVIKSFNKLKTFLEINKNNIVEDCKKEYQNMKNII